MEPTNVRQADDLPTFLNFATTWHPAQQTIIVNPKSRAGIFDAHRIARNSNHVIYCTGGTEQKSTFFEVARLFFSESKFRVFFFFFFLFFIDVYRRGWMSGQPMTHYSCANHQWELTTSGWVRIDSLCANWKYVLINVDWAHSLIQSQLLPRIGRFWRA